MTGVARHRTLLILVVALGLALRLGLAVRMGLDAPPAAGSDQEEYDTYAWNLAQGRGYRGMSPDVADRDHLTAYRPPGTSLAWAALYVAFGHRHDVVRVVHCLAGGLSILVLYAIGRRTFGEGTALLAAAGYAIFPSAIVFSTDLLSEPLATLWFLGSLWACLRFADGPTWGGCLTAGLLLGAAVVSRPNFILLLPMIPLWALRQFAKSPRALAQAIVIPVAAASMFVPWAARNYRVFGEFIPISTMGGSVLLQGNNRISLTVPRYHGAPVWDTEIPEYRESLRTAGDEVERDRRAKRFAVRWIREHLRDLPGLILAKERRAWTPFLQPQSPRLNRIGTLLSWGPVLLVFLVAFPVTFAAMIRRRQPGWLLHLAVLHFVLVTAIFHGYSRYRSPIDPLCILIAASAASPCLARVGVIRRAGRAADARAAVPT